MNFFSTFKFISKETFNIKKKVKNIELWKKLNNLSNFHEIEWEWVKAHSGDPINDMVDKMAKLLNNKELRLSMGQEGKRRVMEEFSNEKMIGQYFQLYQSLIKS